MEKGKTALLRCGSRKGGREARHRADTGTDTAPKPKTVPTNTTPVPHTYDGSQSLLWVGKGRRWRRLVEAVGGRRWTQVEAVGGGKGSLVRLWLACALRICVWWWTERVSAKLTMGIDLIGSQSKEERRQTRSAAGEMEGGTCFPAPHLLRGVCCVCVAVWRGKGVLGVEGACVWAVHLV